MENNCPYDFINEFEDWFNWYRDIYFYKLTPKQIERNRIFKNSGWKLCEGFRYGMWSKKMY